MELKNIIEPLKKTPVPTLILENRINTEYGPTDNQSQSEIFNFVVLYKNKKKLNSLKCENSLKALKLESLINEINNFNETKKKSNKLPNILTDINDVELKIDEEKLNSITYQHLKDRATSVKFFWKKKINQARKNFEIFCSAYWKTIHSKNVAWNNYYNAKKIISDYKAYLISEKISNFEAFNSRLNLKQRIELENTKRIERISKKTESQESSYKKLLNLFENAQVKVQKQSIIDKQSNYLVSYKLEINSQLNLIKEFLNSRNILNVSSLQEITSALKNLYFESEYKFVDLKLRIESLSQTLSIRKKDLNNTKYEYNKIIVIGPFCSETPNGLYAKKPVKIISKDACNKIPYSDISYENPALKSAPNEIILITIYTRLITFINEIISKISFVQENLTEKKTGASNKNPEKLDSLKSNPISFERKSMIIPIGRKILEKRSTTILPNKSLLHISQISRMSPDKYSSYGIRDLFSKYIKDCFQLIDLLLNNQIILLFIKPEDISNYFEKSFDTDLQSIFTQMYSISHYNLQQTLERNFKSILETFIKAKSSIPENYELPKSNFSYPSTLKSLPKPRLMFVAETSRNRNETKTSLKNFTRKKTIKSTGSHSPQVKSQNSIETLKEIRDIDRRLRVIRLNENRSCDLILTKSKMKLPNLGKISYYSVNKN